MQWCCARPMRMRAFASTQRRHGRCLACDWSSLVLRQPTSVRCHARLNSQTPCFEVPPYPVLVREEVRHVGDAIAFVVADTIEQAKDGAEAIIVAWEELPHVIGAAEALKPGAPLVWQQRLSNVVFDVRLGNKVATSRAFTEAVNIVSLTLVNQRLVTNYLDTRGVIAEYDTAHQRLTLTLSSQGPHAIRDVLAEILHLERQMLRVVTPDVGGGFGTKLFPYREYRWRLSPQSCCTNP